MEKPDAARLPCLIKKGQDYGKGLTAAIRKQLLNPTPLDAAAHYTPRGIAMEIRAIIHEDGSYWAEVQELPGCFASGENLDELKEALIEAISMCLTEDDAGQAASSLMPIGMTVATGPLVAAGCW